MLDSTNKKKIKKKKDLIVFLSQISEGNCLFYLPKNLNEDKLDRVFNEIKYYVIKPLILLKHKSIMDTKEVFLQWLIDFLLKSAEILIHLLHLLLIIG